MNNVEVFITDVRTTEDAAFIIEELQAFLQGHEFNFDLEDCDRILRVEAGNCELQATKIMLCLHRWGFQCEVLTY
jgi:hypothetical protein